MDADQQAPLEASAREGLAPLRGHDGGAAQGSARRGMGPVIADSPSETEGASLTGGGTAGNERLTAATGILLVLLLAVIGVTLLRLRSLISIHLFVGLVLIPIVGLKLASTGYRFMRYYTANPAYRKRGAPPILLRSSAPIVVLTTIAVLARA